jgi:hypothetical protein
LKSGWSWSSPAWLPKYGELVDGEEQSPRGANNRTNYSRKGGWRRETATNKTGRRDHKRRRRPCTSNNCPASRITLVSRYRTCGFETIPVVWSRGVARWFRWSLSVADPFVRRCLTSPAMLPFPHPAHRTGRADLPHPALGEDSHNRRSHCM